MRNKISIISIRSIFFNVKTALSVMGIYWNKIALDKIKSNFKKKKIKYVINTEIGRFYFYFKERDNSEGANVSGSVIFFSDTKNC